jgi:L-lactate dehydrogenase complex protein LldG
MPDDARATVLAAVRRAVAAVRDADPDAAYAAIERRYRTGDAGADARSGADRHALLDLLTERLEEYGVAVQRVAAADLPTAVAAWAQALGVRRWVVPDGLPEGWLARLDGPDRVADDAPPDVLDASDAVLTSCAVVVAETGTIALDGGAGQGRRAVTLVPDVHLCVVHAGQVVAGVPEGVARLHAAVVAGRPITFVSGPSATSDIELVRVAGVHGPRTLAVLLVDDAPAAPGAPAVP